MPLISLFNLRSCFTLETGESPVLGGPAVQAGCTIKQCCCGSPGTLHPYLVNTPHTELRCCRTRGQGELHDPYFCLLSQSTQKCGFMIVFCDSGKSRMFQFLAQGFLTVSWCWKAESLELSFFSFRPSCLILMLISQLLISRRVIATFRALGT